MLLGRSLISRGCQLAMSQAKRFSSVAEAFMKHEVVPDVIDVAPEKKAELVYDGGVKADLGNILTPTQVKSPPKVTWDAEEGQFYTLIKVDPDAPSRKEPMLREWHHWMVVNIPGNSLNDGETLSEYISSGPPPKTGLHRYVYLIYKQPGGKLSDAEHGRLSNRSRKNRSRWSTRKFVAKHNLGDPIAGNFFQSEFDDYVPLLYETLRTSK